MIENNPTNVYAAFEMLMEEMEAEIDFINKVGAKGFEQGDYERAQEALERAGQLTGFRDKVVELRKDWDRLVATYLADQDEDEPAAGERRNLGRLRRGLRTSEPMYFRAILASLAEMEGSGKISEVLPRVELAMKGVLKDVDYEPLASDSDLPRWRNTAQWARWSMVKEGLLKGDSPRGMWEITDSGRAFLTQGNG